MTAADEQAERRETASDITLCTARVVRTASVTPRMRRVTLGGETLRGIARRSLPADAVKLFLPEPGAAAPVMPVIGAGGLSYPEGVTPAVVRAYTIRRYDPKVPELDIDVFIHGDGPSARWATSARAGDEVGLIGPRRCFVPSAAADWYLLAGDEAALPAIGAILESLPAGQRALALIEVADQDDEQRLATEAEVEVRWLHRGAATGTGGLLEHAVRGLGWRWDAVQAWIAGEAGMVRGIRRYLRGERGLDRDAVHATGYWRRGLNEEQMEQALVAKYEAARAAGHAIDEIDLD